MSSSQRTYFILQVNKNMINIQQTPDAAAALMDAFIKANKSEGLVELLKITVNEFGTITDTSVIRTYFIITEADKIDYTTLPHVTITI